MRVAVIGGGICGFSCALQIVEYFKSFSPSDIDVTVIAEHLTPNTTGDGSAGLWGPFLLANTDTHSIYKWSKGTHKYLERLWLSQAASEAGVCLLPVVRLTKSNEPMDLFYQDIVYGCQPLTSAQLAHFNAKQGTKFTRGVQFISYTAEPLKFLPYLMKRFVQLQGKIVLKKVDNWQQFIEQSNYNVIINCTGLGARQLLNDEQVYPIRGQVSRIKANWIFQAILDESDDGNYIIPNTETVVLGGTHQEHDFNTSICSKDKEFISKGCQQLLAGVQHSEHLFDWVGLRPGRTQVRLEQTSQGDKIIIHNYGHGGSGVTLAWGCAQDVLNFLIQVVQQHKCKL